MKAPSMIRLLTATLTFLVLSFSVNAQSTPPQIPDVETCENWAERKGTISERYETAENYLGCIIAGSNSALMMAIQSILKDAEKTKGKFLKEKFPMSRFFLIRQARYEVNSSFNMIGYTRKHLAGTQYENVRHAIGNYMDKMYEKTKILDSWVSQQSAILDAGFPKEKKMHDLAKLKVRTTCLEQHTSYLKAHLKGDLISTQKLFLDIKNYNTIILPCAEVNVDFYDLLPTPKEIIVKKKRPLCYGKEDYNGWNLFWQENSYSLKPKLYDIKNGYSSTSLRINRYSSGTIGLNFHFRGGTHFDSDIQQIFVDGVKIHEGNWSTTKYKDGKLRSAKAPKIDKNVIALLEKGKVCEIRIISKGLIKDPSETTGFRRGMVLQASAKFSLLDFKKAKSKVLSAMIKTSADKKSGRCRG